MTFDIVTVFHNETNRAEAEALRVAMANDLPHSFVAVDNRERNRGFARACNLGAAQGEAPYIGFLNPDVVAREPFLARVLEAFEADPETVVTGERFRKPQHCVNEWGCWEWVCGAAFFVRRSWWNHLGGFDERFEWSWEETDFIRQTEAAGKRVTPISLPITHESARYEGVSGVDAEYKQRHFRQGRAIFDAKWRVRRGAASR